VADAVSSSCVPRVHLHFPEAGSLKAKRAELNSVRPLRQRHGRFGGEVEHHGHWQRSTLAVAFAEAVAARCDEAATAPRARRRFPQGARVEGGCLVGATGAHRMTTDRMRRVDEAVREVLSTHRTHSRTRGRFVTVTSVETSADLRHARVFVSVLGDEPTRRRSMDGLQSAHGYLQKRVARELRLKNTPTLQFLYDDSVDRGLRVSELLEEDGAA
jgi:ribosome-binding factor A